MAQEESAESEAVFSKILSKEVANHIAGLKIPARESLEGYIRLGPVNQKIADEFLRVRSPVFPKLGISHSSEAAGSGLFTGPKVNIVIKPDGTHIADKNVRCMKENLGLVKRP